MSDGTTSGADVSVGVLTPSGEEHGLTRYAGTLAAGMRRAGALVEETTASTASLRSVITAVRSLDDCDVLHVQHTSDYWGSGWRQVVVGVAIRAARGRRPLVVTAHDFHTPYQRWPLSPSRAWRRLRSDRTPAEVAHRIVLRCANLVVACSRDELDVLAWTAPRSTAVVPHYVEGRPGPAYIRATRTGAEARDPQVVVLGWMHRRKGQHWAVRALAQLSGHELVLAGSVNERNRHYLDEVLTEAAALGVASRTRCTGYLPDDALDEVLAAADVGLAPYERIAASGSIATLVAAGVPVVARRTPYLADLAAACPTAVALYEENEPLQIADAVRRCLKADRAVQRLELTRWAELHSPLSTGARHLAAFSGLTDRRASVAARHRPAPAGAQQ